METTSAKQSRLATAIAALLLACFASAATPPATALPDSLRVPDGHRFLLRAIARGGQIYTCEATGDRAAFDWKLKAPEAELFDASGASIGRHTAGPSWQLADGSRVVGEVMQRSPVPEAIPWLLLRAKSHDGAGALANASYVLRLETKGGVAPSSGCDRDHAGAEARVAYSAKYDFYGSP
jgi:Protein of unknown function (DUF3455)